MVNQEWWSGAEWRPFDYANKQATRPTTNEPVWVCGTMPGGEPGVAVGYFDGFTMCLWNGTDDISVAYWTKLYAPEPPEDVAEEMFADELDEEDED